MRTRTQLGALQLRRLGEMALYGGTWDLGFDFGTEPGMVLTYEPHTPWDQAEHDRRVRLRQRRAGMSDSPEPQLMVNSIDWGSEHGSTFATADSGRRLWLTAQPDLGKLRAKVERFVAKQRENFGTRAAGKTMLGAQVLASSYAGMHNEGCYWVDATGSYPFYGPWLPHPEPEVFYQ